MQFLRLQLSIITLYCPTSGELICDEESGYNEDAFSLMGHWVNDVIDQPYINDPTLIKNWDAFAEQYEKENSRMPDAGVLDAFLEAYPQSKWIVYRVESPEDSEEVSWFVVDLDASEEEDV